MYVHIYCHSRNQQRKIDFTRKRIGIHIYAAFLIFNFYVKLNHFFPGHNQTALCKTDSMNLNISPCGVYTNVMIDCCQKKNPKINNSKYTKIIFKSNIVVILFVFLSYRILSLMVLSRQSLIKITVGVFSKIDVVVVHTPL